MSTPREPEHFGEMVVRQAADQTWRVWSWSIAWGRRGFTTRDAAVQWAEYAPAVLGLCRAFACLGEAEPSIETTSL